MKGPPLGPGGEDITWPDQVAQRGRKASSTRKIKPQTPSRGVIMVMLRSRCTAIRMNACLASSSNLAPIMSSKMLRLI